MLENIVRCKMWNMINYCKNCHLYYLLSSFLHLEKPLSAQMFLLSLLCGGKFWPHPALCIYLVCSVEKKKNSIFLFLEAQKDIVYRITEGLTRRVKIYNCNILWCAYVNKLTNKKNLWKLFICQHSLTSV